MIKTMEKKKKSNNEILIVLLILFFVIELGVYFFIVKQVETSVDVEVAQYQVDIEKEINNLMGYKEELTVGKLGGYAPDEAPLDLEWFMYGRWLEYPDSTLRLAGMKNFISSFSDEYTDIFNSINEKKKTSNNQIAKLECLYTINWPHSVWEIKHLYKSGSLLYVQSIVPYAWGYKKCASFEKQYRPNGYRACKEAFEFLTKESEDISRSFTDETSKIEAILSLNNKYFDIRRVQKESLTTEDDLERQQRTYKEKKKYTSYSQYGYVYDNYSVVFYEKQLPEIEYQIYCKTSLKEKEVFNKTLNDLIIVSVFILLLFVVVGFYSVVYNKKKVD